jgi:hypothetical protein
VLRVCERLHLTESSFQSLPYAEQIRLIAYDHLRAQEEQPQSLA